MADKIKGKNVHEIVEELFKTRTTYRVNPTVDKVQNSVTKIMPNNPKRLSFVIVNLSNVSIYISPDGDVSSSKGIILFPNGGTIIMKFTEDLELVASEWYGIANAPNSDIYVLEVVSQR